MPYANVSYSDSHVRTSPLPENSGESSEKEVEYITTYLISSKANVPLSKPSYLVVFKVKNLFMD